MVPKTLLSILGFVMAVLLVLSMISFFGGLTTVHVSGSGGEADLSGIHFEQVAATTDGWQHYPDQLLEPDELAGAVKGDSQKLTSYGTYALRILVRDEETFVLSFTSVEYSTKVFIGGDFVEEIGKITTSAEGFEPVRRPCYYVVEPKNGEIELVLQYTNFYSGYGKPPELSLGHANHMFSRQIHYDYSRFTILAIYLMAFLLFIGLFVFKTDAKENLYFALICLLLSIRECFIGEQFLFALFPDIPHRVIFTLEYLMIGFLVILFFAFIRALFPGIVKNKGAAVFYTACVAFLIVSFFTGGNPSTPVTVGFLSIGVYIILYLFAGMIRRIKTLRPGQRLSFIGLVLLFLALGNDMLHLLKIPIGWVGQAGLLQRAMLIFIFIQMTALFIQFIWVERQLGETREKEAALTATNETLQMIDRQRIRFLSDVSHELKTPLTVMSNYAQLTLQHIRKGPNDDRYTEEKMLLITSQAKRMAAMVEQILDVARIEEGRMNYEWKPVQLDLLIEDLVEVYFPVLNKNHNKLEVDMPEQLPSITADSERLGQMLLNLVNNAIRFTKNDLIRISARRLGGEVVIAVKDNGIGMSQKQMDAIFDRFTTSKDADDKKTGTGLGLYISKAIIEAHQGHIQVESAEGEGSTFTVYLPIKREGPDEGENDLAH